MVPANQPCDEPGCLGTLLRREGLYASNLKTWQGQRDRGVLSGLAPKKRGRKESVRHPLHVENEKLRKENERLTNRLRQAEIIIDVSASNIPVGTTVTISAIPQYGTASSANSTLSGTDASSTASASVNLSTAYSNVITATTTYTLQAGLYWNGEKVEKAFVKAVPGKNSEVAYICC